MISARASQELADYLLALGMEFAPAVVEEFRARLDPLVFDRTDRTKEALALIADHDLANEPRTLEAYFAAMRAEFPNYSDA